MIGPKKSFADVLASLPPPSPNTKTKALHPRLVKALVAALRAPTTRQPDRLVGAPRDDEEAWRMFVLVVLAKRHLRQLTSCADRRTAATVTKQDLGYAVHLGEGKSGRDRPSRFVAAAIERYGKNYRRSLKGGWKDGDVLDNLAALYSAPPRART